MPVPAGDHVGDGAVVVDPEALGLRERTFEAVLADGGGEVEQGARDRRDGDALVGGHVTGIEGA
jgi:hypothetical protein